MYWPAVDIVGLTAVIESDTAYMIPCLEAMLLEMMVESNSKGKREGQQGIYKSIVGRLFLRIG